MERRLGSAVLALERGDLTAKAADAIANAANEDLAGGGGVDGAIHRGGGPDILAARARTRGGGPPARAVATTAGRLPARWVFHAVGPFYEGGGFGEPELLASAYRACLRLAEEKGARTIAFPSISTGVYGYPVDEAAQVALATVRAHLEGRTGLERVTFVLFDAATLSAYERALEAI